MNRSRQSHHTTTKEAFADVAHFRTAKFVNASPEYLIKLQLELLIFCDKIMEEVDILLNKEGL